MYRDGDGDELPTEKLDSTATTVIPATRRSATFSVRSAQDYVDSAQSPEEAAHAAALLRQATEIMESATLSEVSEATLLRLSIQRSPSDQGNGQTDLSIEEKSTGLKSCLRDLSRKHSTTSGR